MKTRNQLKRERAKTALMTSALVVLSVMLCCMMVKSWAGHPAEQHVNGYAYMESIGGDFYGHS